MKKVLIAIGVVLIFEIIFVSILLMLVPENGKMELPCPPSFGKITIADCN